MAEIMTPLLLFNALLRRCCDDRDDFDFDFCMAGGRICRGESIREMARAPKDECSGDGVCLRDRLL